MFVLCRVLGGSRGHTARRSSAGEGEDGGRQSGRRAAAQPARISKMREPLPVAPTLRLTREPGPGVESEARPQRPGPASALPRSRNAEGPQRGSVTGAGRPGARGAPHEGIWGAAGRAAGGSRVLVPARGVWLTSGRPGCVRSPCAEGPTLPWRRPREGGGEAQQGCSPNVICRFE